MSTWRDVVVSVHTFGRERFLRSFRSISSPWSRRKGHICFHLPIRTSSQRFALEGATAVFTLRNRALLPPQRSWRSSKRFWIPSLRFWSSSLTPSVFLRDRTDLWASLAAT